MRSRKSTDLDIIYGRNPILDAIAEGKSFERIYLKDSISGPFEKEIRQKCKIHDIPLKKVPQVKLDKLTKNRNHQGIAGIGSIIQYQDLEQVIPHLFEQGKEPIFVLLDNVQDVRNIGAIARSAEVFGTHGIIISGKNAGMITQDSLKASAGALARLFVIREKNTVSTIEKLQSYGIPVIGTSLDTDVSITSFEMQIPTCILLGSEGYGLHDTVEKACDHLVKIPQTGETQSLNVSVSAAIILYELQRNR